jgi:hypothetical protein
MDDNVNDGNNINGCSEYKMIPKSEKRIKLAKYVIEKNAKNKKEKKKK